MTAKLLKKRPFLIRPVALVMLFVWPLWVLVLVIRNAWPEMKDGLMYGYAYLFQALRTGRV